MTAKVFLILYGLAMIALALIAPLIMQIAGVITGLGLILLAVCVEEDDL